MKKTKRCIAILCAMVMMLSAISVVSFTANAESKRYYPTLTYATNKNDIKNLPHSAQQHLTFGLMKRLLSQQF